jgi:hypothetical protein
MPRGSVRIFFNGNSEPGATVLLGEELAAGEVLVLCHAKASPELLGHCDLGTSSLSFNGNDALLLECDGVAYDSLGQLGFDPGTGWSSEGIGTADHVLRRRCASTARPGVSDPFDVANDWVSVWPESEPTSEALDFSGLGSSECALDAGDPSADGPDASVD